MAPQGEQSKEVCPVDHPAREEWLRVAREAGSAAHPNMSRPSTTIRQDPDVASNSGGSWTSYFSLWRTQPEELSPAITSLHKPRRQQQNHYSTAADSPESVLGNERTVSSIPRTEDAGPSQCPISHGASSTSPSGVLPPQPQPQPQTQPNPAPSASSPNAETSSPERSASGNWVYPSESQFFSALRRKGHVASPTDMPVVVPVHNAVNERAWSQILEWEAPYPAAAFCTGPKLHSFSGDSRKLTPKARLMTLLGYQRPFDRHDWTIDRCGTRVDYVIDFYSGRGAEGKISFYLDVRPKLNSWQGVKMRALRGLGLV